MSNYIHDGSIFQNLRKLHKEAQHSYLTYTSIVMSQIADFGNDEDAHVLYRQMLYKWPDVADAYLDVLETVAEKYYDVALEVVRKDLYTIIESPFEFIWSSALQRVKFFGLKEVETIRESLESRLKDCDHAVDKKNILIDSINDLYDVMTAKLGIQYPQLQRLQHESNSLH